jgi:hypothetical protein
VAAVLADGLVTFLLIAPADVDFLATVFEATAAPAAILRGGNLDGAN